MIQLIYLDYSATTPVDEEVLQTFIETSRCFIGNPNSLHQLGSSSKQLIDQATKQIATLLGVKPSEIIYTSGSSEANNLAIKGICHQYQNRGKHILTTALEHASILEPLHYLETEGYEVEYLTLDQNGRVDLDDLKAKLRDDTILVSVASVSSELGILQPIYEIAQIVSKYPKCFFHSDMTQSIGKVAVPLTGVDLISFSAHKFYGIKGIGCLIKKEKISLVPLIHGGESTTIYRSGTPALSLIVSMAKALRLALSRLAEQESLVKQRHRDCITLLQQISVVTVNSTSYSIPHIVNFSVEGIKPETLLHALEEDEIYISTKSACSGHEKVSGPVYAVTKDEKRAQSSLRVSISYMTTTEEIGQFIESLKKAIWRLQMK